MRKQPLMRDHFSSNMALSFYTFVPLMKDHLSYKTNLCDPVQWSLVAGIMYSANIDLDELQH